MRTSSFLVDADQRSFVCEHFFTPVRLSPVYNLYYNGLSFHFGNFRSEYFNPVFKNVRNYKFSLYTFMMYIC